MKRLTLALVLSIAAGLLLTLVPLHGQQATRPRRDGLLERRGLQYLSPPISHIPLRPDSNAEEIIPDLALLTLADGSTVIEGVLPKSGPLSVSILVDKRTRTYHSYRVSPANAASDARLFDYRVSAGTVVAKPSEARPSGAATLSEPEAFTQQSYAYCWETGDITIATYDPEPWPNELLVSTRSYAYVGEDWWEDPWAYQSLSQAFNWQNPQTSRTTRFGTTWHRDSSASWDEATPPSFVSLFADAEQYQYYYNTDFCPFGCGYTWVTHYLYARASRSFVPDHFATATADKGGSYSWLIHHNITNNSHGDCSW